MPNHVTTICLAALHPTLTFDVAAFDEGWNFGGVGQFNGRGDYREGAELATDDLYERVYGHAPDNDDDDDSSAARGAS